MRKTRLAVVISSVLLGTAVAQADPTMDPSQKQKAQGTSQTEAGSTSTSTSTPASPSSDTSSSRNDSTGAGQEAGSDNVDVGARRSNVDEQSSSGSYYPNSAGTVGDSPAKPTETSVDTQAIARDNASENTDQWTVADADGDGYLTREELTKAMPTSVESFDEMDVDSDKKLTRDEFRTWDESRKASMEADKAPDSGFSSSRDAETSAPDDRTSSSPAPSGTDD